MPLRLFLSLMKNGKRKKALRKRREDRVRDARGGTLFLNSEE